MNWLTRVQHNNVAVLILTIMGTYLFALLIDNFYTSSTNTDFNDNNHLTEENYVYLVQSSIETEDPVDASVLIDAGPYVSEECFIEADQLEVVKFSYDFGAPYDLGYTLAAIALKESNGGRVNVNISDPSGGYYHVTLDKVLRHKKWSNNSYNLNRAMNELVINPDLAAELAVKELIEWRRKNTSNWMAIWASYHAGSRGKFTTRGKEYADDIRNIISKIKACNWSV